MKPLLFICFTLFTLNSFSQDKNSFYALDAKMNQTVLDSSKYILWIHETDSARWQWDYYLTWGPLVKSTRYSDHDGKIMDGRFCFYNTMGNLDSTGIYKQGKKNGSFYKLRTYKSDSIVTIWQTDYLEDSLVRSIDLLVSPAKTTGLDTMNEKESGYPGGVSQWQRYLIKNLRYPERAQKKEIQGQVRVFFMVDKEGNIVDPYIQKSLEYSTDQETLRMIIHSGKWEPAQKGGVPVNSYKVQPLNYRLESQ